jgi:DNA mismatch repair protein MutH
VRAGDVYGQESHRRISVASNGKEKRIILVAIGPMQNAGTLWEESHCGHTKTRGLKLKNDVE